MSKDPREHFKFVVLNHFRKPLQRQIKEAVRIKYVMNRGILMMRQGQKARKVKMNRKLMNRNIENFSPWRSQFKKKGGGV